MRKTALWILMALSTWACAPLSTQYHLGTQSEMNKRWDEAIQLYEKASFENPREPVYRLALERAKLGASLFHLQEARKLVAEGKREEAKAAYAKSSAYNPRESAIVQEARLMTAEAKPAEPESERIEFPIKLRVKDEALQLKFPGETGLRSIFSALGRAAGVSIVFDETFRDVPLSTDLSNMTFEQALRSLCVPSKNFYRIVDERTVAVIPDTPMKRLQYDVNVIKTFYLSNVAAETMVASLAQMLRSTVKAPTIIADKGLNWVTIRDTPQVVELAERLIKAWDKPKSEVLIDLEIMEVSRTRLRQLGVSFDNAGATNTVGLAYNPAVDTSSTTTSNWFSLGGLDLSKANNFSISLPTSFLQFLETDSDTKVIAQPRIRGISDEEISHKVGQKIPIPRTTFSTFAAGGVNNVPITNFDQQDVGIEIKIKPSIHREGDVTLACDIKVTSLGGKGYADIPIINNREIKNVMRLRNGETNLIAGLLRDEERKSIKGVPGLKDLPLVGRLFGAEDSTRDQTDVILTITPYIIRAVPLTPEDAKPFWVDVDMPPTGGLQGGLEENILDRETDLRQAELALRQRRPQEIGPNAVTLAPASLETPERPRVHDRGQHQLRPGNREPVARPQLQSPDRRPQGRDRRRSVAGSSAGRRCRSSRTSTTRRGPAPWASPARGRGRGFKGSSTLASLRFESRRPASSLTARASRRWPRRRGVLLFSPRRPGSSSVEASRPVPESCVPSRIDRGGRGSGFALPT